MSRKLTFKGGVHPNDYKNFTSSKPIRELEAPGELIFPMSQHIGAPCTPCVEVGDYVKMGTKIADSDAFLSVPIHSSVSGVVKKIEPHPVPNGSEVMSIIIENDFKDEVESSMKPIDYTEVDPNEIPALVREAGIVGLGGATFPTHVKLMPPEGKKIDTIIINGTECEPYLTNDHRVMLEKTDDVIKGLEIILYRFGITNGHIAVEENKPDAIAVLKDKCAQKGITVDTLKAKYPQGGEKQLIYAVTKRKVPVGKLPSDVGVLVVNVDTCAAIAQRFMYGKPLLTRNITVVGTPLSDIGNYSVRIGTPFDFIIEKTGGFRETPAKIIIGGPMMGVAQFRLDVPLIKGSAAILALTEKEAEIDEEGPCIRCGKCVEHCPMGLMPYELCNSSKKGDMEKCEKNNVTACIECGSCSFECPSKRNLVQNIRIAKQNVIAMQKRR